MKLELRAVSCVELRSQLVWRPPRAFLVTELDCCDLQARRRRLRVITLSIAAQTRILAPAADVERNQLKLDASCKAFGGERDRQNQQ